jgi:hypothetical protein
MTSSLTSTGSTVSSDRVPGRENNTQPGVLLVGDTGFEPVTSSVSAKVGSRLTGQLSVPDVPVRSGPAP